MARYDIKVVVNTIKSLKEENSVSRVKRTGNPTEDIKRERIEKVLTQVLADLKHIEYYGGLDNLIDLAEGKKQQKSLFEEA